jgi:hypothetical protein
MPIAFHTNHPSLKRPRSTSQPPSPSSSSPKRAASDSDDHFEPTNSLLGHNMDMSSTGRASSPLREHDSSSGEWVKRTEDVHLNEVEDQGNERYKQLYNDFLGQSSNDPSGRRLGSILTSLSVDTTTFSRLPYLLYHPKGIREGSESARTQRPRDRDRGNPHRSTA